MADKKLNEVTANATVDYVIGTLNDGSTVRISKANLAAVLKTLLPTNGIMRLTYDKSITTSDTFQLTIEGTSRYFIVISYDYNKAHSLLLVDRYGIITLNDGLASYLTYELQSTTFIVTAKFGSVGCKISVLVF